MWTRVFPRFDQAKIGWWWKFFSLPWQGKDCPKTGSEGKEDLGGGGNPHLKKINTLLTKGKVSCSFPWIKVRVLSICLWSVFLGWTIGVCSVGGQVSISFLVLVLSVVDISLLKWPLGVCHLFFWGPSFPSWPFLFNLLQNTSLQDWLFICFNCNELHTFLFAQTIFGSPPWYIFYFSKYFASIWPIEIRKRCNYLCSFRCGGA